MSCLSKELKTAGLQAGVREDLPRASISTWAAGGLHAAGAASWASDSSHCAFPGRTCSVLGLFPPTLPHLLRLLVWTWRSHFQEALSSPITFCSLDQPISPMETWAGQPPRAGITANPAPSQAGPTQHTGLRPMEQALLGLPSVTKLLPPLSPIPARADRSSHSPPTHCCLSWCPTGKNKTLAQHAPSFSALTR